MILLKVKIKRIEKAGATHLEYPKPYWDSTKVVFGPVYETVERGQGRTWEYCIIGVDEREAPNFLRGNNKTAGSHKFEVREVTRDEAISSADPWLPVREVALSQDAVLAALARKARGLGTDHDDQVLDPNDETIGMNKTKSFAERLDQAIHEYQARKQNR